MKPETSTALADADRAIAKARAIVAIEIADEAARLAYYAQFHAAQALIFERSGKVSKTHKGVHAQFHRLVKSEPGLVSGFAGSLSKAFRYKVIADYETGSMTPISPEQARSAITTAEGFVNAVRHVLTSRPTTNSLS